MSTAAVRTDSGPSPATEEKHPKGLYVLFASEMWERYSFYTVNSMLSLYLRDTVQGFSMTAAEAGSVYSWYLMFVYFTPLLGGLIADLFLGFRKAILIGAVFFIAGHALLAVPDNLMIVYLALCCLVIGNGFFKPNVSSMVGNLYREGSHLKDKAYLIFYMGINVGAALAPIVAGIIQPRWGFHPAFFMGAIGMIISMLVFSLNQKHVRYADRIRGKSTMTTREDAKDTQQAATVTEDLPPMSEAAQAMGAVPEWKRIMALIVIFIIVIVFWMIFHQNSLTLTFWAEDHTEWTFVEKGGILSNAINAIFIVLMAIPLAAFWGWLDKKGLEPSTPMKMTIGMILTGLSMVILYFAAQINGYTAPVFRVEKVDASGTWVAISKEAREHLGINIAATPTAVQKGEETVNLELWRVNHTGQAAPGDFVRLENHDANQIVTGATRKASLWWLILMYGVISLGELMLSPMGLSLVSQVAPIRMRGLMMGGWFTATAIGNKLTAIGGYWDLWSHTKFFMVLALMAFATALVLFLLLRPLKKAMPGV